MDALLLVDHGSRRPEANELLEKVAALVQARVPGVPVAWAHMELAEPTIPQALGALTAKGAMDVVVVPYMLGPGRHAIEDIPRIVSESVPPGARARVASPLGVHGALADVVIDRANEADRS